MNKLKLRRLELEFSQYEIERLTQIPQAKISLYERGYREPSSEEKKRLSKVLKASEKELFSSDQ